ncbi:phosphotransferase family protein [Caulobacter sp.]|jgi:aminoglycoside phosphotransferase (APT) family kinase protein|uniref:Putative aminoglycoside phosphotransferase n=1 Tax=Caulobacter vibrioides OR37 TaxID=1292034 RepID=R0EPV0_CAUVI|nr:putative aminoglycoside phosphotransferase [Caulobacter vibrioides OR37]MBQ1562939.1 phosphotransferase family protein [Caulobacter sp.]
MTVVAALDRLAPRLSPTATRAINARRLSGGASLETWAFDLDDGAPLILRRRTSGSALRETALPLDHEASLIRAASAVGAPAPSVVHVCAPEDDLGEAYVMRRLEGETLGRRIVRDEAFAAVRPGLARRCGEVLARIHAVPTEGLPELATSDARGELARYEAIYRELGAERPIMEAAFRWLEAAAPSPPERPVLVHGDFRNGNLMIHPKDGLVGVLDWELAHLGDPAEDLGWICVNSWRFGEWRKPVGGFGDYADLLAGYGDNIPLERVRFWQALGSLKWGVMCLMMYQSFATGADRSVERAMIGRRASETEIDLVALMEAAA